jgi:ribose-phosphate pyrophosphokinase
MDLHSPQIQGFFKIPVDHLYATPVLVDYFLRKNIPDLVIASPDVGFGKQANRFAALMHNAPVVYGNKMRRSHDERAELQTVIGEVRGKNVLIVDDFTISGGTLIEMAVACKEHGARDVYAAVTHGVFSKGSAAKIARSPIKELIITDTIGYRFEPLAPCIKVVSVAGLFADAVQSIHRRESVSRLFDFERADGAMN